MFENTFKGQLCLRSLSYYVMMCVFLEWTHNFIYVNFFYVLESKILGYAIFGFANNGYDSKFCDVLQCLQRYAFKPSIYHWWQQGGWCSPVWLFLLGYCVYFTYIPITTVHYFQVILKLDSQDSIQKVCEMGLRLMTFCSCFVEVPIYLDLKTTSYMVCNLPMYSSSLCYVFGL